MTQPTIFDHLISYLEHPFFQIPVISFCEQKCICFNPGTEDCPEYKRIHKEYIEVLTAILDAFREDMKLSHDQVIKAVQDIDSVQSDFREYFRGIEQVLAIESYPLFVRMMQRCNIELQEQALLLILQRQGVQTPAGQPNLQSEDEILAMVLRQSKQEFEREEAARRRRTVAEESLISRQEAEAIGRHSAWSTLGWKKKSSDSPYQTNRRLSRAPQQLAGSSSAAMLLRRPDDRMISTCRRASGRRLLRPAVVAAREAAAVAPGIARTNTSRRLARTSAAKRPPSWLSHSAACRTRRS
ncbi:hypothetical protein BOX15_Mlig023550g1 [Macrostomum lignano]|uniref:Cilia- and flagella-associated protein 36 n=1 Tax=Macrostomum lignano TaxID=282301 RepID=A0A267EH30_9PLAT|nr:hypothetical protein BOX15_Mlig023550g1 [Macrostomum lignano]